MNELEYTGINEQADRSAGALAALSQEAHLSVSAKNTGLPSSYDELPGLSIKDSGQDESRKCADDSCYQNLEKEQEERRIVIKKEFAAMSKSDQAELMSLAKPEKEAYSAQMIDLAKTMGHHRLAKTMQEYMNWQGIMF